MLSKPKEESGDGKAAVDVRGLRKTRTQNIWTWKPLTLVTTILALLFLAAIVHSSLRLQVDPQGCVMSMMIPSYIKLSGFDTEHSRFATKYSLYLYREETVDEYTSDNLGLRGAPVLFIPGNAGSYKQVRSLSSEASRYYQTYLRDDPKAAEAGIRALDFFTLDFNEDLSAFHGQTLVDQAEYVNEAVAYILSLYQDSNRLRSDPTHTDPGSVILIGHSMGGIVARAVLVTPKYQQNSVNTIITMSTPHARPPVSFDPDIVSLYKQINDYWRESYTQIRASKNPLWQTTLISIAGGGRDTTVPSDYTSVASLVPETHGFTVFTTTIPNVWTSMDHLAITWADQVRKTIVRSLYEIVDVHRASRTKTREERMKVFRKWFLSGLEPDAPKKMLESDHQILLTLGDKSRSVITKANNITMRHLGAQSQSSAQLLKVPVVNSERQHHFSFLTDQKIDIQGSFERLEVLFCSTFPLPGNQGATNLPIHIDLSDNDPSATRLACKRPTGDGIALPASTRTSNFAFDQTSPFTYLQYDLYDLQAYQFIAVVDKATDFNNGWAYAEIASTETSVIKSDVGLLGLLLRGLNLELSEDRPLSTDIQIPALRSSLLTYHLQVRQHGCDADNELFTPLIRQHIEAPYESKYFVNFKEGDVNLHGVAPFMPPRLDGQDASVGVAFQLWSDPTCASSVEIRLRPDFFGSLGKLVVRYRTIFAAFPLLVVAMVLRKQFRVYDNTGVFISFSDSLDQSLRLPLPVILLSMTFFATAFTTASSANMSENNRIISNGTAINFEENDLLLGSQSTFFWFLVPLAGLISVGACVLLNYLILFILDLLAIASTFFNPNHEMKDQGPKGLASVFVASPPRRRIITTVVLLFLVATIIPYPFAYVVACIVQLITCTRALRYAKETRSGAAHNFFNYTYSILILMLWVLPINLPVLVVWIHNMAVHWLTPFSSHHNIFSIMPFIVLVETLSSGVMVPSMKSSKWATNLLFFALAVYSALYGMTYAYRLHYIANIIALWLVVVHFIHSRL